MAPRSSQYRMADRVLEGHLADFMRTSYADSGSWEEVARQLLIEHSIIVSGQTLRRWAKELGLEDEAA